MRVGSENQKLPLKPGYRNVLYANLILIGGFLITAIVTYQSYQQAKKQEKEKFGMFCEDMNSKLISRSDGTPFLFLNDSLPNTFSDTATTGYWQFSVVNFKYADELIGIQELESDKTNGILYISQYNAPWLSVYDKTLAFLVGGLVLSLLLFLFYLLMHRKSLRDILQTNRQMTALIKDYEGKPEAFIGKNAIISEKKKNDEPFEKQQHLMRTLMDYLPDHIYFKDLESRFVKINKSQAQLFGLDDPDEAIGKSDLDFFTDEHSKRAFEDEQEIIRTGKSLSIEEKETYEDRPDTWVSTVKMPLLDREGNIMGTFGISRDVTRQHMEGEEIRLKNEELQRLNAEKDKFFSIIAHDLRSPFGCIVSFSSLLVELVKEKDYKAVEEYSQIIQQSSQQAMELLTNLMQWALSQTGRMQFKPANFDMTSTIDNAISLVSGVAEEKSISIQKILPGYITLFADKEMIGTVLRNLIANAIKFTYPGGKIVVSAEEVQGNLLVTVKDNGVGISDEVKAKLFRIDENYSTYGTQNEVGTGLGLIICKEFVEKHRGEIWVESDPSGISGEKGSVFSFTIPIISEQ
ncbi:MAG: PAS domain-containing sensor histidine kinase [Bacteroidales bacterium]|nr:PAS domain-containing sensor histidine kinase [Bacteroidales bacterium]